MPRLTDPEIIAKLQHALGNGRFTGYITWKPIARQWVEKHLEGWTTRAIGEWLFDHVASGGRIDQVPEKRPEWSESRFHYDVRLKIADRLAYVEMLLLEEASDDPTIHVVSIHDA